jgi:hypothetical protein
LAVILKVLFGFPITVGKKEALVILILVQFKETVSGAVSYFVLHQFEIREECRYIFFVETHFYDAYKHDVDALIWLFVNSIIES